MAKRPRYANNLITYPTPNAKGEQPDNLQPDNLQPDNLQPDNLQPPNLQPPNLQPPNHKKIAVEIISTAGGNPH
ncbi:hypothetical protein [Moorena producens]|uniref:hypothetical protein n=1 Tax=Moorena producens TaxID=1155739 RepID=UPI0009F6CA2E|nr:hypothetical protein [Moorena producens]